MKTLAALLMLLAVEAHAATWTWDATKNVPQTVWPCDNVQPVSNGGITATFGETFTYSENNPPEPEWCEEPGFYTDGQWRPEGWGQWAVKMNWNCVTGPPAPGYPSPNGILFSTPIRTFAVDIVGGVPQHWFSCLDWVCSTDGGATWNTHCTITALDGSITSTAMIEGWNAGPVVGFPVAQVDGVAGCIVDPPAQTPPADDFDWSNNARPFCNRQRVTVVFPIPVAKVYFKGFNATTWGTHLYLDNFEASTTTPPCPDPPCEWERASFPRIEGVADTGAPPALMKPRVIFRRASDVTPATRTTFGRLKLLYR